MKNLTFPPSHAVLHHNILFLEALVPRANAALYQAKAEGRNRVAL
jgi:PleD family two-component response regulator